MAEEKAPQENKSDNNGNGIPEGDNESIEDIKEQLAKTNKLLADVQKAQSGSDGAVTKLKEENEELRNSLKEKMTDAEKEQAEKGELRSLVKTLSTKIDTITEDSKKKELNSFKLQKMAEHKLNLKYSGNIFGSTAEEIETEIVRFKTIRDEDMKDAKKELVSHGEPENGQPNTNNTVISRSKDFDKMSPTQKTEAMEKVRSGKATFVE